MNRLAQGAENVQKMCSMCGNDESCPKLGTFAVMGDGSVQIVRFNGDEVDEAVGHVVAYCMHGFGLTMDQRLVHLGR